MDWGRFKAAGTIPWLKVSLNIALKVKVICSRIRKNPRYTQNGNRELVTVIECLRMVPKGVDRSRARARMAGTQL